VIPIPAIDLKAGRVVRLLQGRFDAEKVYGLDAEKVALSFEEEGARRIHVVDLDGALYGEPKNLMAIESILTRVKVPVEVGGGIRDISQAARYFGMGAAWVILGTKACLDAGFLKEAMKEFGERIIVGIDAKDGCIATDGWTKVHEKKAATLAREVRAAGARTVIYTDIATDGALKGPNLEHLEALAGTTGLDIIASGGVGSLADLRAIMALGKKNIVGTIIGKAIYEKKFTVKEAVETCSQKG
jgi:phosphoribosylformimino-5-aminoimidazole carboxamide ribotide isomerase